MKKITESTFTKYKYLSNLNTNPSKTLAGFIVNKANKRTNSYDSDLYLTDGEVNYLWKNNVRDYYFLNDDSIWILDHLQTSKSTSKGYEKTVYQICDIKSGEVLKNVDLPLNVSDIKKVKDDLYLIMAKTSLDAPNFYMLNEVEKKKIIKNRKDNNDYQVIDEYPFFFNGQGYINKTRTSLFLYDYNQDIITKITNKTTDVETVDINYPNILFSAFDYESFKDKWGEIYTYNIETSKIECCYDKKDFQIQRTYYYNNEIWVNGTYGKDYGMMENSKLYVLNNNDLLLKIDNDLSLYASVGSDCRYGKLKNYMKIDGKPYFLSTVQSSTHLLTIAENEITPVIALNGSLDDFVYLNDKFIIIGLFNNELQEIYSYRDLGLTKLTEFNNEISNDYYIASTNKFNIYNDGFEINGWYLLPYNYNPNKKYPSILNIHGGPKAAYGEVFYHEMQQWASMGYIVYFLNPRGSDGKGNKYADLRRNMGKIDYSDIMRFTDEIVLKLPIDQERMVVTGGSYGGYMTNWIIGHSNRFKCAISQRSISNWISMVMASDYGIDFPIEQEFNDLYNCHDELWECSPLNYVNNVKTPTLFIHSYEDYRCPLPEAYQMYTGLKVRGVDTRICAFKGENHELSRSGKPLHRLRRLAEIRDWMNKYIRGER